MPTYKEDQLTFAGTHPSAMTHELKQFVPFAWLLPYQLFGSGPSLNPGRFPPLIQNQTRPRTRAACSETRPRSRSTWRRTARHRSCCPGSYPPGIGSAARGWTRRWGRRCCCHCRARARSGRGRRQRRGWPRRSVCGPWRDPIWN